MALEKDWVEDEESFAKSPEFDPYSPEGSGLEKSPIGDIQETFHKNAMGVVDDGEHFSMDELQSAGMPEPAMEGGMDEYGGMPEPAMPEEENPEGGFGNRNTLGM